MRSSCQQIFPTVPVLRSPPPFGPHVFQMPPPVQLTNTTLTDKPNSDSVSGTDMITSVAADTACNTLINVPRTRGSYTDATFKTRFCAR